MKYKLFHIICYAIILIIMVCLFLWETSNKKDSSSNIDTVSVHNHYHYDTTHYHFNISLNTPKQSEPYTAPANVDKQKTVNKFYTDNLYDTTVTDSNITAKINLGVKENRVYGLNLTYKLLKPMQTTIISEKIESKKPPNKLFLGGFGGANASGNVQFGPEILLITSKDHAYKVNYDLINKGFQAGIHWKLSLKKQ